jgi:septum formation protein
MSDPLILGSSSPYRAQALRSLGLVFTQISPNVDETPRSNESPEALAARLAETKAVGIAQQHAGAIVIGSDQVGFCSGRLLSKPGSKANAIAVLRQNAGQIATFYTGLVCARQDLAGTLHTRLDVCKTELKFRLLTDEQVTRYVEYDDPVDVAGAFKAESLGIALFDYIRADDPSALIGLPLIALTRQLQSFGVDPLRAKA